VLEDGTLRSEGTQPVTEEERRERLSTYRLSDVAGLNPTGSSDADVAVAETCSLSFRHQKKIGTWNVRSMHQGKLEVVKNEMTRLGIEILGISELRWCGMGHFQSGEYKIIYSGHESKKENGVAIICKEEVARAILGYNMISDRIISVRLQGHPTNITIVQVYAPTADAGDEKHEEFYASLQETIDYVPKGDVPMIMGDWNAKVGDKGVKNIAGLHGLGDKNDAGEKLLEFCAGNELIVSNTWFQQHKRRLYTWTSPGGEYRNQIDYILIKKRWRSAISSVKTMPGADCGTDHELLVAKIKVKLKKVKGNKAPLRYDLQNIPVEYNVEIRNRFAAIELDDKEPDELWEDIKMAVNETAAKQVPRRKYKKRKAWISQQAIDIAEERRKMKKLGKSKEDIQVLNRRFQRQVRQDKEQYISEMCKDIENENNLGRTRDIFKKIKDITGKFTPRNGCLRSKDGKNLTEATEVKTKWKEYTEKLYKADEKVITNFEYKAFDQEPMILKSEVIKALQEIKNGKAPGHDDIPIELFKEGGEEAVTILTELCQRIWISGKWPEDWKRSVYIPIPKKGDPRECENNRTIALISHASKVLLKIIHNRIEGYMEKEIPDNQAGFRRKRGTRDQISNLRRIIETAKEYNEEVYLCFIDYSKAFDCVNHEKLWNTLRQMSIPEHYIQLLKSLYDNGIATVRTEFGETEPLKIGKGVRQGCILSPYLFNLYSESIMREAGLEELDEGVKVGGRNLNNLRYADDTTLLANRKNGMQTLLDKVICTSERAGLYLNVKKTKIMSTRKTDPINIDGEEIDVVSSFQFLGSVITDNGECKEEIRRRLILGRTAMAELDKIWKDRNITRKTKVNLVKALVFPVAMYGCETWTMKVTDRKKIQSFEYWCWRRMLRIPWTAKKSNAFVKEQVQPNLSLEQMILKQKLTYFGHIMRGDGLEKAVITGMSEGARRKGRPKKRWLDEIVEVTGLHIQQLKEAVWDRRAWRARVMRVTKDRDRSDGTR